MVKRKLFEEIEDAVEEPPAAAHQYQGKDVLSVREAKQGDPIWVQGADQVVVTFADGSEATVKRNEVLER